MKSSVAEVGSCSGAGMTSMYAKMRRSKHCSQRRYSFPAIISFFV